MTTRNYSNTASEASLSGGIIAGDTAITVASYTGFPAAPYTAVIDRGTASEEVILVTAVSGATLTATRGYDGTTAKSHDAGAQLLHVTVAKDFSEANIHVNATTGVHGVTGTLVDTTSTQTLTNKTLTTPTLSAPVVTGTAALATATVSGTLTVTGTTALTALTTSGTATVATLAATTGSVGTLTVTGTSTLTGALSGSTATFSGLVTASTAPTGGNHLVNKTYADALGATASTASTIARRDASGNLAANQITLGAAASTTSHAMRKGEADSTYVPKGFVVMSGTGTPSLGSSSSVFSNVPFTLMKKANTALFTFSGGTLTCVKAGWYQIGGLLQINTSATIDDGDQRYLAVHVNGTQTYVTGFYLPVAGSQHSVYMTAPGAPLQLSAGDTVQLRYLQDSAATQTAVLDGSYLYAVYISD